MTGTVAPAAAAGTGTERPAAARLAGVDAARGLAVIGMIVVHVNAATGAGAGIAEGRSAVLFAVLAGLSLGLLSGGARGLTEHRAGTRRRPDRTRIAVRAAVLFVLGVAVALISTGAIVILPYYAVMFVLVLPLLWVRPAALLASAAAWALAGPQVSFLLRRTIDTKGLGGTVTPGDFGSWSTAGDAALRLLLTGAYPVATWMPFVLAGLAIGRLDLQAATVRVRLAAAGVGAAVLGYGGSWLALDVLGGRAALTTALAPAAREIGLPVDELVAITEQSGLGTTGTLSPAFLLLDAPHTGTTFEIVGSTGVAVVVLVAGLVLADRARTLVVPFAAAGALAATLYVGHIAALALVAAAAPVWLAQPWPVTALFVVAAVALALGWRRLIGRGPVEWMLHAVSTRAGRAR